MKKLTRAWLRKAEADFALARQLLQDDLPFYDAICFHSQQAGEKFLKALMQEIDLPIPKTHDLLRLLLLLLAVDNSLGKLRRCSKSLSRYGVDYRYPGFNANGRKAQAAHRCAEDIRATIRESLGRRPRRSKGP
jgi:HEPN domain-containing protein